MKRKNAVLVLEEYLTDRENNYHVFQEQYQMTVKQVMTNPTIFRQELEGLKEVIGDEPDLMAAIITLLKE